jgi:hypothetical protein
MPWKRFEFYLGQTPKVSTKMEEYRTLSPIPISNKILELEL